MRRASDWLGLVGAFLIALGLLAAGERQARAAAVPPGQPLREEQHA